MTHRIIAIVGILVICVGMVAACAVADDDTSLEQQSLSNSVIRWEDDEYDVICWIYKGGYKGGISCIPKDQLEEK